MQDDGVIMYKVEFYGINENGDSYLVCRKTKRKLLHSNMVEFLSQFNADFELDRGSSNSYSLIFENESDYNDYLNYTILVG